MKKSLLLSVLCCASVVAMDDKKAIEQLTVLNADGQKTFVKSDKAVLCPIANCTDIEVKIDCWDEGAHILEKNGEYSVRIKTAVRSGTSGYLTTKVVGPLHGAVKPRMFLVKDPKAGNKFSCDVICLTATGKVVATNLNAEKEIYSLDLPSLYEGFVPDRIMQTSEGDIIVTGNEGKAYTWSHAQIKEKGICSTEHKEAK